MYGDQLGEFACGYWGLKGSVVYCPIIYKINIATLFPGSGVAASCLICIN